MDSQQKMIIPRNTQSSKSINGGGEYSESIPVDLITEILSRLPSKSIARFRCVSKPWESIFRRPCFTELFFTRSSSRPQVLFAFNKDNEVFFFSIPQPRNHDEIVSPLLATFVTKTPFTAYFERSCHINGLVFLRDDPGDTKLPAVILNPSTRQSFSIPNFNSRRKCFWGYDPIEKQYKLLSIISSSAFKVLTIGSGNLLWRNVLCCTKHYPLGDGICVDGVLYYIAMVKNCVGFIMIVSFDIKSEKFNFMKSMENYNEESSTANLINYNGKLGSIKADDTFFVKGSSEILTIWVLDDAEKQEWSRHIHVLPSLWKDVVGEAELFIVGVIGTEEIVLSSIYSDSIFYVVYYNTKRKSVVKVEIQGMEECRTSGGVFTYLNHIENLKLLS